MNSFDNYEKARDLLTKRFEKRLRNLQKEQERTREERAWKTARNEQDRPDAPHPSGGPKPRAPDLEDLVRKYESVLRAQDARQCEALQQEHLGELGRLEQTRQEGKGQGLSPEEIAVMALPPRQPGQRKAPMRNLADEFSRQSLAGTVTDKTRMNLEAAAEKNRTERAMNQARQENQRDSYETTQAAALAKLKGRAPGDEGNKPAGHSQDNEWER